MRAAILHLASLLLLASPALAVLADPPTAPVKPVGKPMKGPMTQADMKVIADPAGLDFGIVACRRSVPHVQRLIDYIG